METLTINAGAVTERIQAMRISAELSLSRVQTFAETNARELARVVAGYRGIVADVGGRLIRAQATIIQALATKPGDPTLTALLPVDVLLHLEQFLVEVPLCNC